MTLRDIQNLKEKIKKVATMAKKMYKVLFPYVLQRNCEDCAGVAADEDRVVSVIYYQAAITMYVSVYNYFMSQFIFSIIINFVL